MLKLEEKKSQNGWNKYPNEGANEAFYGDAYLRSEEKIENYRKLWEGGVEKIRLYHQSSESGESFLQMYAELMNVLLQRLYNDAIRSYKYNYSKEWSHPMSLMGIGALGRNALAPYNNVELLFLYSGQIHSDVLDPFVEIIQQEIVHLLWNLKMKVSYSFRTINDTILDAKKNFRIMNAQLDARLICGSKDLFSTFQEMYNDYFRNQPKELFINHIIREKHLRHKTHNNTIFLLEPDVKFGVGGLRDFQLILWLARAKLKVSTLRGIEDEKFLNSTEVEKLTEAYNFLIRVRNELEFQNDQESNILSIDKQVSVALILGYKIEDPFARKEVFMKAYYKYAQCIYEIAGAFEERLTKNENYKKSWFKLITQYGIKYKKIHKLKKEVDGFIIIDNLLTYKSKEVFQENPIRLIRVFKHAQLHHATPSVELKLLIKNSLDLITEEVINDPASSKCLCALLQMVGEVYSVLQLMHDLGVLACFVPEIRSITHLVQHEYYHQYTVARHTLNAIKLLDEIFEYKNPELKHYYNAIKHTNRPWLAYLILLLHDLGKAQRTKDTVEYSVTLAKTILNRLEITPTQQDYILFSIKHQFQMTQFCQKYDINNPEVVMELSSFLGNKEILNYLYVAAYCNGKGTGPRFWNNYKETLHKQLFNNTLECFFKSEESIEEQIKNKKTKYRQLIYQRSPQLTHEEITKTLESYPDNYFILNHPPEIELHFHLLEQLKKGSEINMPLVHWENDINQCVTVVTIVSWNLTDHLTKLAGVFTNSRFNILNTKIFTVEDNITIHTFYVIEEINNYLTIEDLKKKFQQNLHKMLINKVNLALEMREQRKTNKKTFKIHNANSCVNVHHENATNKTILEVQCPDQIGLLQNIASLITEHGFKINHAKISTEHKMAIDSFHITKINPKQITTIQDLMNLREHFLKTNPFLGL